MSLSLKFITRVDSKEPFHVYIWYCFGSLLGESVIKNFYSAKVASLRIGLCSWILFCFVIGACYSGNLRAFLISPFYGPRLSTLEAIEKSELAIDIVCIAIEPENLKEFEKDPLLSRLYARKNCISLDIENLDDVYYGKSVVFNWRLDFLYASSLRYSTPGSDKSLLDISFTPMFPKKGLGLAFNKRCPWLEQAHGIISRLVETGIVSHYMKTSSYQAKMLYLQHGGEKIKILEEAPAQPLKLEHLSTSFVLFLICHMISGLYLSVGEIYWYKRRQKQ